MRKSDIEGRLRDHYVRVRLEEAPDPAAKARAVALVAAEAGQEAPAASMRQAGFARFVLGQIRYVRTWVWAAQAGLLALLACGSLLAPTDETASACTAVVAALTVLVGMPDVLRSRESNVMELEYACRFDSCQVLAARLIVLGLSDVVVLTFAVLAVPALARNRPAARVPACLRPLLPHGGRKPADRHPRPRRRHGALPCVRDAGGHACRHGVAGGTEAVRRFGSGPVGRPVRARPCRSGARDESVSVQRRGRTRLPGRPCPALTSRNGSPLCHHAGQSLTQRDAALAPCATNANEPLARRIGGRKGQGPWNSPLTG